LQTPPNFSLVNKASNSIRIRSHPSLPAAARRTTPQNGIMHEKNKSSSGEASRRCGRRRACRRRFGTGIVVEGDDVIGTTRFWQFTSGIQGGARNFSMIIFFRDKEALEYYKTGKLQFMGQAGIAAATVGAAGTPAYNSGEAIVTVTRLGLMYEATISGAKFTYKPLDGE
jgi:hypothetical protein